APDRTGAPDLAAARREGDGQPREGAVDRPRHAEAGGARRRDGDRPEGGVDGRRERVPVEEPQLPVRRLEGAGAGAYGHRGRRDQGGGVRVAGAGPRGYGRRHGGGARARSAPPQGRVPMPCAAIPVTPPRFSAWLVPLGALLIPLVYLPTLGT